MHLVRTAQVDPARLVDQLQRVPGSHQKTQALVELIGVGGRARVQNDQVGDEPFVTPILVGEKRLAHQRRVLQVFDPDKEYRVVARDPDRPEPGERQTVLSRSLHLQNGVGVCQ